MANITRIKASSSREKPKIASGGKKPKEQKLVKAPAQKLTKQAKKAEKLAQKQAKKASKLAKRQQKGSGFWASIFSPLKKLGQYIHDAFIELRQVRWPSRNETWKLTASVIIYVLIVAGIIMLLDALFKLFFNKILGGN